MLSLVTRASSLVLVAAIAACNGGCVSRSGGGTTMEPAGQQVVLKEGQYREVAVTGSNIPVLSSTTPIAHPLPAASRTITMTPAEFQDLVRRGDVLSRR